jgi:hypothetical protein
MRTFAVVDDGLDGGAGMVLAHKRTTKPLVGCGRSWTVGRMKFDILPINW